MEQNETRLIALDTEVMPTVDEMAVAPTDDPRIVCRSPHIVQLLLDVVDNERMAWSDATTRGGRIFSAVRRVQRLSSSHATLEFGATDSTARPISYNMITREPRWSMRCGAIHLPIPMKSQADFRAVPRVPGWHSPQHEHL